MWENVFYVFATIVVAIIFAETAGYLAHVLLHSHKYKWLSQAHMIHHMKLYGPKMPQLHKEYLKANTGRFFLLGVGAEWVATLGTYMAVLVITAWLVGIPLYLIAIFVGVHAIWAAVIYSYMHDAMHLSEFWMINNTYFKKWFLKIRSYHEIHHRDVDDIGRMNTNYGICFFVVDRVFGTFQPNLKEFNTKGYKKAEILYKDVIS